MTLGILGGMGPETTADFFIKIIRRTPAKKDAEHLRVIIDSNPRIPDRTAFIRGEGPSPVPLLCETARNLVRAGTRLIAVPCITAHAFLAEIRDAVDVPVLSAIELTARHIEGKLAEDDPVAIISSTGTLRMGIFQAAMPARRFVLPTDDEQERVVMDAVYGPAGVKTVGPRREALQRMRAFVEELTDRGAKAVILGCTEFSVLFAEASRRPPLIDPMWLLADEAVRLSRE